MPRASQRPTATSKVSDAVTRFRGRPRNLDPRTCRCPGEKPNFRVNPSTLRPLWLCDDHAARMDSGHAFEVVPIEQSANGDEGPAAQGELGTLWRIGDRWRDLRPELLTVAGPVWLLTARGSIRVLDVREGWQLRVPSTGGAVIADDRRQTALSEISVATPCGITTWGNGPHTWSSSMPVLLLATGLPDGRPATRSGLDASDVQASFSDHPPGRCGALHCQNRSEGGRAGS